MLNLSSEPGASFKVLVAGYFVAHESPRAHWLRRARKLGSPLRATGLASINKKFLMGIEDSSLLAVRIFNLIIDNIEKHYI
jgi:hypothetical protein